MKNSAIKSINTAGLIGYIVSIIMIVLTITAMVITAITAAGAMTVSKDEINVKMNNNINITSQGNFLGKLDHFIKIGGVDDLSNLVEKDAQAQVSDSDISQISVTETDDGLSVNVVSQDITFSVGKIIAALLFAFLFFGAVTVSLYMVKSLMKSLKSCDTPFSQDIIKKMTNFAYSLIPAVILYMLFDGFKSSLTVGSGYEFSLNIGSVLLVAVVYILVMIFKYGAELQKESDETL